MSLINKRVYQFGEFELKVGSRTLTRNGQQISLGSKAFEVLTCLVVHAGEVVTKDELLKTVWPESFVEEGNLSQHIFSLRKALGDQSGYIVTVPGRGYQFTATVREMVSDDLLPLSESSGEIFIQRTRERAHLVIEESSPALLIKKKTLASGKVWPYALVAAGVLTFLTWTGWKWLQRPAHAASHEIVLADFINTTGDAAFDRTLKRALEIDLDQSPYIDVLTERESVSILQLMGRKSDDPITSDTAKEVCVRSNRQTLLTGNISSVGHLYLLTLEATDCNSGKMLASAKAEAGTKEEVLGALDSVADHVREGLGESEKSMESYQVPIVQATTSSLDALKAYSIGSYLDSQGKNETESLPLYQKAVELDAQFAMAYGSIATDYYNLNEFNLASQYYRKAFDLCDRVSAKEKFNIQAHYYADSQKDLQQGIKVYQLWTATYPNDWVPWLDLANEYTQLGQYAPAIASGERAVQVGPDRGMSYSVLARAYKRANRFAEAKSVGLEALRRGKDSSGLHASLYEIAVAEHDHDALSREIKWGETNGGWFFVYCEAMVAASVGKYKQAEELFHNAYNMAERDNLSETADDILIDQAAVEAELGLLANSRATLSRIRKPDTTSPDLAILHAQLGDTSYAQQFLEEQSDVTHPGTLMTYISIPRLRAILAMEHDNPQKAIKTLEPARPFELADYAVLTQRGRAYLLAKQPEIAAKEYKKIIDNPGVDPMSLFYSLAHLDLARAYAMQNNIALSRNEYETFLALWKDADTDIPILQQAIIEYSHLH